MNIEESIIKFKKMIERDKDTLRYWKSDTFGHYEEAIKKLEKDVLVCETLLTAYEKEKEKNKKIENELEKHIKFCEQESEGSLNNEICHIALKFNKRLLDIINEEE